MGFKNAGGSVGSGALVISLLWALHCYAKRLRNAPKGRERERGTDARAPAVAPFSPACFQFLIEHAPVPFVVLDLREDAASEDVPLECGRSDAWLRASAKAAADALQDKASWEAHFGAAAFPTSEHLLVLMSPSKDDCAAVATAAAHARVSLLPCVQVPGMPAAADAVATPRALSLISRDALAHLLTLRGLAIIPHDPLLIDVRRSDEVAFFGGIPEARQLPLTTLITALAAPAPAFARLAHFQRPESGQLLIFHSRRRRRAELAARVACAHGFERVLVLKEGSNGWGIDEAVLVYDAYAAHDPPPQALPHRRTSVDIDNAAAELRLLGIL